MHSSILRRLQRLGRPVRRTVVLGLISGLAACASPAPPLQFYRLPSAVPVAVPAAIVPAAGAVQLMSPVRLPDYLDRDALLVPSGATGLQPLAGQRWAEPLRDSVPRLLRQDLATLWGEANVWAAPVPAGVRIARQLRVELLAFDVTPDRSGVTLQARWTWVEAAGGAAPVAQSALITAPAASPSPDALVAAHRLALWRLAERLAERPVAPVAP